MLFIVSSTLLPFGLCFTFDSLRWVNDPKTRNLNIIEYHISNKNNADEKHPLQFHFAFDSPLAPKAFASRFVSG